MCHTHFGQDHWLSLEISISHKLVLNQTFNKLVLNQTVYSQLKYSLEIDQLRFQRRVMHVCELQTMNYLQ